MTTIDDIEVIVLDVLGTLVNEPSGMRRAIHEALPSADNLFIEELYSEWQLYVARQQQRIAQGDRAYADSEALDEEAAQKVAATAGIVEPAAIARLGRAGRRLPLWSDSLNALEIISQQFPVLALSNASHASLLRLNAHTSMRWHQVVSSETVRAYKPAREIYQFAVDVAACPPERVLMVAAHAWDLRGAQALGMRTAYIQRPVGDPPMKSDTFDWEFGGMDELLAVFISSNRNTHLMEKVMP
jgi:2-haloacid dehalogenase